MLKYHIGDIAKQDEQEEGVASSEGSGKDKWTQSAELTKKKQVSHNSYIFTFKFKDPFFNLDLKPGQHISFLANIDGKQIMRPYTPIECKPESSEIDCLIKIYPQGAMS